MCNLDNRTDSLFVVFQVPGSVLKPPPSGGVGGGIFPPQLSPQHIAMLSSIYPPHIQFQLVSFSPVLHL